MINQAVILGKWNEIKGALQKAWGKLTNDELERVQGNFTEIAGLIQQKYGGAKRDVSAKLEELMREFDPDHTPEPDHKDSAPMRDGPRI